MIRKADARGLRALETCPSFRGLGKESLLELASFALSYDFPKNNVLLCHGDPAGAVHVVVTGAVKETLTHEDGREVTVAIVRPGGLVGLLAALDGGPQPANAITISASRLVKLNRDDFVAWAERHAIMRKVLIRDLSQRLRQAYHKIGEHALLGAKERLLLELFEIALEEGEPEPGKHVIVFTRPTLQELAQRVGSSREVISRLLKELLESEVLEAEGRVIRVSETALVLRED